MKKNVWKSKEGVITYWKIFIQTFQSFLDFRYKLRGFSRILYTLINKLLNNYYF